jgi:hypothetical protein
VQGRSLAFSPSDLYRGEALISASESDGDSGALYILAMAARFTGFSVKTWRAEISRRISDTQPDQNLPAF